MTFKPAEQVIKDHMDSLRKSATPYLLHGEELARTEAQRKSGRSIMTAKTATPLTDAIRTVGAGGDCRDWKEERVEALKLARKLESDRARLIEALRQCCTALQPLVDDEASERRVGIAGKAHGRAYDLLRELEGK